MAVQVLGPYIPAEPAKPYLCITKDLEALAALDTLHRRIVAARDEMRLIAAKDEYGIKNTGVCVIAGDDFALFFRTDNGRGMFFWSPIGRSAFGLKNVKPGQSWSYSRGIWVRHEQSSRDIALWQSYSAFYPDVAALPAKGRKKTDSGDSDAAAAAAMNMKPAKSITQADLASMGL